MLRFLLTLCLCAGCQYGFDSGRSGWEGVTVTVPYIEGDVQGKLTDALICQLAASSGFVPVVAGGAYTLKVKVVSLADKKIGYRYHRDDTTGELRHRLMPAEDRRVISAEVVLIEESTGKILIGPDITTASAEYDYVDPDSIRELTFTDSHGNPRVVLDFSLGQLDSIEGAQDDVNTPLFRLLSQKIIDGILSQQP